MSSNGTLSARQRIGPYTIERVIGSGAMGMVYAARRDGDSTLVALKTLRFDKLDESVDAAAERFDHEVKATNSLHHPSIIKVFESGTATLEDRATVLYFSMELVPGETLHTALKRGPFFAPEAAAIVARLADALNFTHAHGIVHRDVKPGNVFLAPPGRVVLVDFGICKFAGNAALTSGGGVMGTLPFMAPEQLFDEAVDHRTDVFALGSLLFTLVTRRYLRPATSVTAVIKAVRENKDLEKVRGIEGLDPVVREILLKALQPDPAQRFQRARELMNALNPLAGELPAGGPGRVIPPTFTGKRYAVDSTSGVDETSGADFMSVDSLPPGDGFQPGEPPSSRKHKTSSFRNKWLSKKKSGDLASYMERVNQVKIVREVAEPIVVKAPTRDVDAWEADVSVTARHGRRGLLGWLTSAVGLAAIVLLALATVGALAWVALRKGAATLDLSSRPAGAQVLLDGVPAGTTPLLLELKGRGATHQLELRAERRRPHQEAIAVPLVGDLPPLSVELPWQPASLSVVTRPAGAVLLVDGSAVCKTPCEHHELQANTRHLIGVLGEGCAPEQFFVELEPAAAHARELVLRPTLPRQLGLLQVLVDKEPVRVDGVELPVRAGVVEILLHTGAHLIETPREKPDVSEVELATGQLRRLDLRARRVRPTAPARLGPRATAGDRSKIDVDALHQATDHALYQVAVGQGGAADAELARVLERDPSFARALRGQVLRAAAGTNPRRLQAVLDAYLTLSDPPLDVDVARAARTALEPGERCR